MMNNETWIVSELASVDFCDSRLNDRLIKTAMVLAAKPSASIAAASTSKAIAKGAYRMFSNPNVSEEEVIGSHIVRSIERAKECTTVYAIQDTTSLNYSAHPQDLGVIGYNGHTETNGIFLHSTLMVNQAGKPLGLLHQETLTRNSPAKQNRASQKQLNRKKPAKEKESKRWIESLEQTASVSTLREKIITLADRESDIYEFVAVANKLNSKFIVRACRNRSTSEDKKLFSILAQAKTMGTHHVYVEGVRRDLEVKCIQTEILPPSDRNTKTRMEGVNYIPQKVYVVEAFEKSSSKDKLHWILLTNLPTTSLKEAISRLDAYTMRWSIEQFHRILKSGCGIEKTLLESAHGINVMIALKSIIAVRLFQLTMSTRENPKAPCTEELSQDEWRVLHARLFVGKSIPQTPPTLEQATLWLAQLGGYKRNPAKEPPGMTVIWRGWQELQSCIPLWKSLQNQAGSKGVFCG